MTKLRKFRKIFGILLSFAIILNIITTAPFTSSANNVPSRCGDITSTGRVTMADVLVLQQYLAGNSTVISTNAKARRAAFYCNSAGSITQENVDELLAFFIKQTK